MRKIIFITFISIPLWIFSQKISNDTIYIKYDNSIDKHFFQKGKIQYFEININNRFVRYIYGTSNINKTKKFNQIFTSRNVLSKIIKNDNPSKKIIYIVVKKQKNEYLLYKSDYLIRNIID